ncbi:hypothetical protein [Acidithiobacillus marinus]|nr:hypothetical protein [Acidithiobacillus marinus]
MATYYQNRSAGQKTSSWSQEVAGLTGREARPHMAEFLRQQGFLLR